MKKRYLYLISFIFLMFLVFLFLVSAGGTNDWIECTGTCSLSKCGGDSTATCCKLTEKLNVGGADKCCISNTWAAPIDDICDGLDNDCNGATLDGSGVTAPNCALTAGVCAGSKKSCGGGSGWLACTSANYGANYESTESKCDDLDNDCDSITDEGCDDDNDNYCDSGMTRVGTPATCTLGGNDCSDSANGADGIAGNADDGAAINPGISENTNALCSNGVDNDCDGNADCADSGCNSKVCGTQSITCTVDQNPSCNTATGDIYADTDTDKTCDKLCGSGVCSSCTPVCDRYLKADCVDTCTGEASASNFIADAPVTDNGLCTAGQTSCPSTSSADTCGAGNLLTEYYCSGNDATSSAYDCDNSDNTVLDNAPCGDAIDGCTTRDYSCLDNSNMDYCSYAPSIDLDISSSSCAVGGAATSWIATGESVAHGEYTAGQAAAACCGDDSSEKIIIAGVGDTKCCNLATKCVDSGGVCRNNENEATPVLCSNNIDDDCDGAIDCIDLGCAGVTRTTGGTCCQTAANCAQNSCVEESCASNVCGYTDRAACYSAECTAVAGTYCDKGGSVGGTCKTPDESSVVCACAEVTDQTNGVWASTNHQDAGKAFNANLFDSNTGACPATSCSSPPCTCYDATGAVANRKSSLGTGTCCGDDASEYYKSNYYGPECTSDVNDCVWSDGNAQASNTGNKEYWCYQHEWNECIDDEVAVDSEVDIGKKIGGVTCAGVAGNKKWVPNAQVLAENSYSCTDGFDNDGDGNIDCADDNCRGITGPLGQKCCQDASADCTQNNCVTESCDVNKECAYSDRNPCEATECTAVAGTYCDKGGSVGGTCKTPDESATVCGCADVIDQTTGSCATPPCWTSTNHQDAGKAWSSNTDVFTKLFDSDGAECPTGTTPGTGSCSDTTPDACRCYDTSGVPGSAKHNSALTTVGTAGPSCCGDDANEFYKKDYYGGECVGSVAASVDDCVWADGNAQASNTGNKEYWCYLHEWNECIDDEVAVDPEVDIGKKIGGVTCAGVAGDKKWTGSPSPENSYSCTDGFDNDGDGKTDCEDIDCGTTVSGYVKDTANAPIYQAKVDALQNAALKYTILTDASGFYKFDKIADSVYCGTYDMIASATDYVSSTKSQVNFAPDSAIAQDFTLALGTLCEADCTYAGDTTLHQECEGANGCQFCPVGCASPTCTPSIAQQSCNLAQPGWDRLYTDPSQPECAGGCVIFCQESCPEAKTDTKANVACEEGKSLIKATKLVMYKGKLLKLNVVVCG